MAQPARRCHGPNDRVRLGRCHGIQPASSRPVGRLLPIGLSENVATQASSVRKEFLGLMTQRL